MITISIFSCPSNRSSAEAFTLHIPYGARGEPANPARAQWMGTHTMPDNLFRAARCHERAAESIKLADASFDQPMEARYRLLAERYIELAEREEALEGQDGLV